MKKFKYSKNEIEQMAFQYTVLMSSQLRLLKRIPLPLISGKARIILHLLKIFLGSIRYGNRKHISKLKLASTICVTASNNQLSNSQKVLGSDKNIQFIHFPGSKKQAIETSFMTINMKALTGMSFI